MKRNTYLLVVNPKKAIDLYKNGTEIYKLFDDDTESLVESEHDLHDAIDLSIELAIEKTFF